MDDPVLVGRRQIGRRGVEGSEADLHLPVALDAEEPRAAGRAEVSVDELVRPTPGLASDRDGRFGKDRKRQVWSARLLPADGAVAEADADRFAVELEADRAAVAPACPDRHVRSSIVEEVTGPGMNGSARCSSVEAVSIATFEPGRYGDSLRAGVRLEQNYGLEDGKPRVPADLPLDI